MWFIREYANRGSGDGTGGCWLCERESRRSRLIATDAEGDQVTFTMAGGLLPAGLALESDGTFSGTATMGGVYQFFVEVCDQADPVACATFAYELRVIGTEVISNEVLPFTGADSKVLTYAALILLVGGAMTLGGQAGTERPVKS